MPIIVPPTRRLFYLFNNFLSHFIFAWANVNFVLLIVATVAWITARERALEEDCHRHNIGCGFPRWGFYFFVALSAAVSFITSTFMALSVILRPRRSLVDALWVYRGVFFSLIPLTIMVYIGWSTPDRAPTLFNLASSFEDGIVEEAGFHALRGILGAFIIDILDPWKQTTPAFVMLHITV